jgi:hypothetical protein
LRLVGRLRCRTAASRAIILAISQVDFLSGAGDRIVGVPLSIDCGATNE